MKLGEEIGSGGSRKVYAADPGYVIKVPSSPNRKHYNRIEALIWQNAPEDLRAWLVPVIDSHPGGDWLIMPRGEPIQDADRPKSTHRALHDWRKVNNWVRLNGEVLLCDYGQKNIAKAIGLKPPKSRDCA